MEQQQQQQKGGARRKKEGEDEDEGEGCSSSSGGGGGGGGSGINDNGEDVWNNSCEFASLSTLGASVASVMASERVEKILRCGSSSSELAVPASSNSIKFFVGNPSIELFQGEMVLHSPPSKSPNELPEERTPTICVIGIPIQISTGEFCRRIADHLKRVSIIRIVKDSLPGLYDAVIQFDSLEEADRFYIALNDKPFNSMEPELFNMKYVKEIRFEKPGQSLFNSATDCPDCPFCLEKIDASNDAILINICNHCAHSHCLSQQKWDADGSCPVCRYCLRPSDDAVCVDCNAHLSLWICLICGNVGCGRFVQGHAEQHFQQTQHTFALELETQRVWDYAGDNYVHRLIQNKTDGKLVEVEDPENNEKKKDSALARLQWEYNFLLTTQLEDQRKFFEDQIKKKEIEINTKVSELENQLKSHQICKVNVAKAKEKMEKVEKQREDLEKDLLALKREVQIVEQLNKAYLEEQKSWREKLLKAEATLAEKTDEIHELQDQIRDYTLFLEAGKSLAKEQVSKEELEQSHIVVSPTRNTGIRNSGRGRRKSKS